MEGKDKAASPEQVDVVAVIKIKLDCIETFRPVLEKMIDATRKEEGNLRYDWYQDAKEPGTFVALESFKNMEAFQAHIAAEHFLQGIAVVKNLESAPT
jgi:quinol monooxygenase YgiN